LRSVFSGLLKLLIIWWDSLFRVLAHQICAEKKMDWRDKDSPFSEMQKWLSWRRFTCPPGFGEIRRLHTLKFVCDEKIFTDLYACAVDL